MPIVYKGRVFSVEVDTRPLPGGGNHEVAIVRHPPSVVLIPMPDAEHVILVRQYRPSLGRELWELPAGSLEPGESASEAAARECEEEIALRPGRVERLISLYPTPGYSDEEMVFFRATDLRQPPADSPHKPDDDEEILARAVTIAEARAMVARGDIIDLKTAYALTLI
jgi:ADP-ribose pyrophosphatase